MVGPIPANLTLTEKAFLDSYNGTGDAHLIWVSIPESLCGNISIAAVYAPPVYESAGTVWDDSLSALICGIQAAWLPSGFRMIEESDGSYIVSGDIPMEVQNVDTPAHSEPWSEPAVFVSVEWAENSVKTPNANTNGLQQIFVVYM